MNNFGTRLKELRIQNFLTQKEVASYLYITRASYAKYETGQRFPDARTLCRIADLYGVSVDYLLGR